MVAATMPIRYPVLETWGVFRHQQCQERELVLTDLAAYWSAARGGTGVARVAEGLCQVEEEEKKQAALAERGENAAVDRETGSLSCRRTRGSWSRRVPKTRN